MRRDCNVDLLKTNSQINSRQFNENDSNSILSAGYIPIINHTSNPIADCLKLINW